MGRYVALLRGINVGGHKKVPMKELKSVFEKHGFKNVKTLLASGNVVFEGNSNNVKKISEILEDAFGFEIGTIVLPFKDLESIIDSHPFQSIKVTPTTRLYVTFLKEISKPKISIPYETNDKSFRILKIQDNAVLSVLDLNKMGTVDAMSILEKAFSKRVTTRNYNTVQKIAGL